MEVAKREEAEHPQEHAYEELVDCLEVVLGEQSVLRPAVWP